MPATTVLDELSLEVKAYVQPLGVENSWTDLGEGIVELHGSTIRVRPIAAHIDAEDCDGDEELAERLAAAAAGTGDELLLEDDLEPDTAFIGRDSCIVWNSAAQELSFCIMFATEMGYDAANSAMTYAVHKRVEGWTVDLFAELMEEAPSPAAFAVELAAELTAVAELGFVERHVVVCSVIRGDYAAIPGVLSNPDVCGALLGLHHPEVIEYLLDDARFGNFLDASASAAATTESSGGAILSDTAAEEARGSFAIPAALASLPMVDEIQAALTRVMRLHALRPTKGPAEAHPIVETLEAVSQRQLAELVMELTSSDEFLSALGDGIATSCDTGPSYEADAATQHLRCLADLLDLSATTHGRDSVAPTVARIFSEANVLAGLSACARALTVHPDAALHAAFCRVLDASLVVLNHRGDEVVMAEVFRNPIVASAAPAAGRRDALAPFMSYLVATCPTGIVAGAGRGGPITTASVTSSAVSSLERADDDDRENSPAQPNDDDDEGAVMTRQVTHVPTITTTKPSSATQVPVPTTASKATASFFTSIAAYLPARVAADPTSGAESRPASPTVAATAASAGHGAQYLFHLLGLHDDEGTTVDRSPTAEAVEARAAIQRHFVAHSAAPLLHVCGTSIGAIPEGVANVFEYLLRLAPGDTRDRLVQTLLATRSPLMRLLMAHRGGRNKAELCANLRLFRAMLIAMLGLPRCDVPALANRVTFANDLWAVIVARLAADRRRNSMAHCVFNSTLEVLAVQNYDCLSADALHPIRKYVMLKYRTSLPVKFIEAIEAAELAQLAREMHVPDYTSPIPFASPSRAASVMSEATSGQRRSRVAEEELPDEHRHADLTRRTRELALRHAASLSPQPGNASEQCPASPIPVGSNSPDASAQAAAASTTAGVPAAVDRPAPPTTEPPSKPRRPVAPLIARKPGQRVPLKPKAQMIS